MERDRLERTIDSLKQENRALRRKNFELEQKLSRRKARNLTVIEVKESDYARTSEIPLRDMLENLTVVFFGLREDYRAFQTLRGYHHNLLLIEGVGDTFDTEPIKRADFVFVYKNCMSHSKYFHAEDSLALVPHARLKEHTNIQLLENGMANVLSRYFHATL